MPSDFEPEMSARYGVAGSRYAAYPPAPLLGPFTVAQHAAAISRSNLATPTAPIALHVHTRFCVGSACSCRATAPAPDADGGRSYLNALLREIVRQASLFDRRRPVEHLQFGGCTPTQLSDEQISTILDAIERAFGSVVAVRREFSLNVGPGDLDPARLVRLARIGLTRLHVDIQDFDPDVQQAMNRMHSPTLTLALLEAGVTLGLRLMSFDIEYGLPRQTRAGFAQTMERVIALRPDRIAVKGFEHLPERFETQRQFRAQDLPAAELRLDLLQIATERLLDAGYVHLGMDRFVLPDDELALALRRDRLQRNLNGYCLRAGPDLLGLGPGSISHVNGAYVQNVRGSGEYISTLMSGALATSRGIVLSRDDQLRAAVIERILCGREVPYGVLRVRFGVDFREHFRNALLSLGPAERDGLVQRLPDRLRVTPRGRFFLRALAMPFDAHLATSLVQARRGG